MNRRAFIETITAAPLAATTIPSGVASASQAAMPACPSEAGVCAGDLDAYFTEEKLRAAITPVDVSGVSFEVVAYNFPSWHPSPFMEDRFGKGWTEYDTLKASRPLFAGHLFPKHPLWGYFNEADPAWAEREIDAAHQHGIDGWLVDWYWHDGTMFYHEQLENGLLKASNRSQLKFALMWANHHWRNVYPATSPNAAATILAQHHSEADCLRVIDYCITHYFREPNYWRIGNGLVFGIFDLSLILQQLGTDGWKRASDAMRARVRAAGLGDLHFQANHIYGGHEAHLRELGIDSATRYHTFGFTYSRPPGRSPWGEGARLTIDDWKTTASKVNVPFFPDCPVGWDDSPRFGAGAHVAVDRSPDQFERLLRAAQYFAAPRVTPSHPAIVMLSAWNEWTEDHVLLPDTIWGYSYLEAVKRVFAAPAR